MGVIKKLSQVKRYYLKGDFNPRSKDQLLAYMATLGDEGGPESEKSGKPTTDKKIIKALTKKNSFYKDLLAYTAIGKVRSTYAVGAKRQLDSQSRIHAQFRDVPSTHRLSCTGFNLTNIVADKDDEQTEAQGFRKCVIAGPECELLEADASAVEAVFSGYFMKDPDYIRLAQLGVHDYLTSHMVGKPASLKWDDKKLGEYFKWIKNTYKTERHLAKKTVHAVNFGQTPYGMVKTTPDVFTLKIAKDLQGLYYHICPRLPVWHDEVRLLAKNQGYLGLDNTPGSIGMSPWRYRHWFWDVYTWDPRKQSHKLGKDSKRVVAYQPQSTNAGFQKEVILRAEPRINKLYFGQTPVRALIHDSVFCEVEKRHRALLANVLHEEMTRPILEMPCPPEWNLGPFLKIGCAIKVGPNWQDMEDILPEELGTASDTTIKEFEEEREDA